MFAKLHQDFQDYFDSIVDSDLDIDNKIEQLKIHLLANQDSFENMLLFFFKEETLTNDNYFYITYTYHDEAIDMERCNEIVISLLYNRKDDFYFEISVFNYKGSKKEHILTFTKTSSLLN